MLGFAVGMAVPVLCAIVLVSRRYRIIERRELQRNMGLGDIQVATNAIIVSMGSHKVMMANAS